MQLGAHNRSVAHSAQQQTRTVSPALGRRATLATFVSLAGAPRAGQRAFFEAVFALLRDADAPPPSATIPPTPSQASPRGQPTAPTPTRAARSRSRAPTRRSRSLWTAATRRRATSAPAACLTATATAATSRSSSGGCARGSACVHVAWIVVVALGALGGWRHRRFPLLHPRTVLHPLTIRPVLFQLLTPPADAPPQPPQPPQPQTAPPLLSQDFLESGGVPKRKRDGAPGGARSR